MLLGIESDYNKFICVIPQAKLKNREYVIQKISNVVEKNEV